jgi:hypothetical protein
LGCLSKSLHENVKRVGGQKLRSFYSAEFLPGLSKQLEGDPILEQYVPTTPAACHLQYHYIAKAPAAYGEKSTLVSNPLMGAATERAMLSSIPSSHGS